MVVLLVFLCLLAIPAVRKLIGFTVGLVFLLPILAYVLYLEFLLVAVCIGPVLLAAVVFGVALLAEHDLARTGTSRWTPSTRAPSPRPWIRIYLATNAVLGAALICGAVPALRPGFMPEVFFLFPILWFNAFVGGTIMLLVTRQERAEFLKKMDLAVAKYVVGLSTREDLERSYRWGFPGDHGPGLVREAASHFKIEVRDDMGARVSNYVSDLDVRLPALQTELAKLRAA